MRTLTSKEWDYFYRSVWREPFALLSKKERGKLVRACRGKAIYDSSEEAQEILHTLKPTGKVSIRAYKCPLCQGFHISSRAISPSTGKKMFKQLPSGSEQRGGDSNNPA